MTRIFLLLFLLPFSSIAQKKVNLTLFGGLANYTGDLQEKKFTADQSGGTIGAGISVEVAPKLMVRAGLQYGKVGADDKKSTKPLNLARNLNFKSPIIEANLLLDYSFMDLDEKGFTPYVFAGLALFHFDPYTNDSTGKKYYLRNLGTEGEGLASFPGTKLYSRTKISIPFGGGIRFRINKNTVLGYEIGLRKTPTDYLDDVSRSYADEPTLLAVRGAKAVELSYRGDELKNGDAAYPNHGLRGGAKYKDWYYFQGITLSIGIMDDLKKLFPGKTGRGGMNCPRPVL